MKNIFKETFDNFEPEPPKSVWENIEKSIKKTHNLPSTKKILIFSGSAIIIISTILLFNPKKDKTSQTENKNIPEQTVIIDNYFKKENSKEITQNETIKLQPKQSEDQKTVIDNRTTKEAIKIKEIIQKVDEISSNSHEQAKNITPNAEVNENLNNSRILSKSNEQIIPKLPNIESKFTITGEQTICKGEKAILSADGGSKYLWSTGERSKSIVVSPSTSTDYSVMISDENGISKTGLVTVTVAECVGLLVPNAFTPNGDGQHDIFKPVGNNIKKFEMTIISRTGQVVFTTHSIDDGWDGTIGGKPAPVGVYVYNISYLNELNQNKILQGSLTLIR